MAAFAYRGQNGLRRPMNEYEILNFLPFHIVAGREGIVKISRVRGGKIALIRTTPTSRIF